MAGLHFDITADNTGFLEKVHQIQTSTRQASNVLKQVGKEFDISSAEKQITALHTIIRDMESGLTKSSEQILRWQESASKAFSEEDLDAFNKINSKIDEENKKIVELTQTLNGYQQALSTIESVSGFGSTTPVVQTPQFYDTKEKYDKAESLRSEASGLESQIANFDDLGGAELDNLRERLAQVRNELNEVEGAAADAASKLGEELGSRAAEASTSLYDLENKIKDQSATVENLSKAAEQAAVELNTLKESGADSSDIDNAQVKYEALSNSLINAQNSLRNLQAAQTDAKSSWNNISAEVENHNSIMVKMLGGYENYNKIISQLPGPIQGVIGGIQGMTGAAKTFIATPLGAVIGAIVLVLQSLKTWFNSSAEGQMAFAEVSGYVSGVLNQLKEIVITVGNTIYNAFKNPQKAVKELWDVIKTNIVNRFSALGNLAKHVGEMISAAFDPNKSTADSWKSIQNDLTQLATGVENLSDKVKNYVGNVHEAAKKNAELAKREEQLHRDRSKDKIEEAKLDAEIAKQQNKLYSGTTAERRAAAAKAEQLINEKYERRQKYAQEELNIIKERNALTTNAQQDYDAENNAAAALENVKTERESALRMIKRRQSGFDRNDNSAEKSAISAFNQESRANDKIDKLTKQYNEDRIKSDTEFALRREQNRINLMKEGAQKTLAQMELDQKKERAALEEEHKNAIKEEIARQKALHDAREDKKAAGNKKYAKKVFNADIDDKNNIDIDRNQIATIEEHYKQLYSDLEAIQRKSAEDRLEESREAMEAYLREFGNYAQQREAIEREYARKIESAPNIGTRMSYEAQQRNELSNLDMKAFKADINWEAVFSDMDAVSSDYLRKLRQQLREALDMKDISAENAKVLAEKINEIDGLLTSRKNEWKNVLGLAIPELEKINRLEEQQLQAQEKLNKAQQEYNNSLSNKIQSQSDIASYLGSKGMKVNPGDIKSSDADNFIEQFKSKGFDISKISEMFSALAKNETNLAQATEGLSSAMGEAGASASGAGGGFAATAAVIDTIVHGVNDNVQSAMDLIEQLELQDTKFGKGFKSFAESSQYATEAWESLKSGNVMGVANGVLGSLRTLGNALGEWGIKGFGSSDTTLEEDIERLTFSNNELRNAIDRLSEKMDDASLSESEEIYENQIAKLKEAEANTRQLMQRSGAAYNGGFLGIGGKGSSNKRIDEGVDDASWKRISAIVGRSITNAAQFWTLSSEEMARVADEATDIWIQIKNLADDGYQNAAVYMDQYIDYYRQLDELQDAYNQKITDTSFDSVSDSFKSLLLDMESDTESFAEDFEKMLRSAVINGLMSDKYNEMLKDWYKDFSEAMKSEGGIGGTNLSEDEKSQLRKKWDEIVNQGITDRDNLFSVLGIDGSTTKSQKATSGGYETMSEDTGQELNGRFTAIQDSNERIAQSMESYITSMQGIMVVNKEGNTILSNILIQHVLTNEYLDDITLYTKEMRTFGEKLDKIVTNTSKL